VEVKTVSPDDGNRSRQPQALMKALPAVFNARDRIRLDESNARIPAAVITGAPDSAAVIDTGLQGGQKLFLVAAPVRQGDDTFQAVLWQAPRFVFRNGRERPLAEYRWTSAEAQWDSTSLTKDGLLAQATAIIEFAIPDGALQFKATARFPKPGASASEVRVLTLVGTSANEDKRPGLPIEVALTDLGIAGEVAVRDLWTHTELGKGQGTFSPVVPFHGARLFRLSRRSE
jgi:hypothetical protein